MSDSRSASVDVEVIRSLDDVRLLPLLTKADIRREEAEALGADYRIDLTHDQGHDGCVISVEVLDSPLAHSDELAVEACARLRDEILVRPEVRLAKSGELRQEARKPVTVFDQRR